MNVWTHSPAALPPQSRRAFVKTAAASMLAGALAGTAVAAEPGELAQIRQLVIERIDWEDKTVGEATAELVDLAVKHHPASPWRNIRLSGPELSTVRVTMHLRNVPIEVVFQNIVAAALGKLSFENGMVHMRFRQKEEHELRIITVSETAAGRLGMTNASAKETLERFGINVKSFYFKADYDEHKRTLLLKALLRECELVESLIELADRVSISIK